MFAALLKGKLSRDQENMEDVLTSNVFGALRYIPPNQGILPFLRQAVPFASGNELELLPSASVKYQFWPGWCENGCQPCEPDVVLRVAAEGYVPLLVCIEAKYRSGKSARPQKATDEELDGEGQEGSTDQLAKEWENLQALSAADRCRPILIYLTAGFGPPTDEMAESVNDCRDPQAMKRGLYWLSWRHLSTALSAEDPVSEDLKSLLQRLALFLFTGIQPVHTLSIGWHFGAGSCGLVWATDCAEHPIKWRFVQ